jgi:predicted DNA-binding protein
MWLILSNDVYFAAYMAIRTQIYLTDEQRARLDERARRQQVTMASLIREAIDTLLSSEDDFEKTFGAAPHIAPRVPSRSEWDRRG